MTAIPPRITPTALGVLRKSILTAMAELADAREDVTLALQMLAGDIPVDEAAVIDTVTPILEHARQEVAGALADLATRRRAIAEERGEEAPPPASIIPFRRPEAPSTGGPNAVA